MKEYFEINNNKIEIPDDCYIGSFEDICSITISDISPIHAKIYHENNNILFEDLGSSGSFVNETPIEPHKPIQLKDNDILKLNNVVLTYRIGEDPLFTNEEISYLNNQFYEIDSQDKADNLIGFLLNKIEKINSKISDISIYDREILCEPYTVTIEHYKSGKIFSIKDFEEIKQDKTSEIELVNNISPSTNIILLPGTVEETQINPNQPSSENTFDLNERTMDIDVSTIKALSEKGLNKQNTDFIRNTDEIKTE